MSPAFSGLGPTVGTYAERVALASPQLGQLFYQTNTDEYVKYGTDTDGTNRWMMADHDYGRNLVVNGGFDVWQRATSATTSTADYYGPADRWQTVRLSSDNQRTFSRQPVTSSDTPVSGFTYFMRCQRDAATVATNSILMATSFETTSVRRTQNKYVTLSFFARAGANYSAASGFLRAFITTGTGTDGRLITGSFTSPTTLVDSNNVLTTSWKRFTVTTSAPVGSTVTQMGVSFQFTPVGTAGASDYYDVTGVQLEAVSAPSDFEFEPLETTLRKCQRYYFVVKNNTSNSPVLYRFNYGGSDNLYHCTIVLPVTPRITNGLSFPVFASGTQIHKPAVRWDVPSSLTYELLPGNSTQYQLNIVPSVNDGAAFYGIYLYGIGIIYSGEL
jgi:hypothetical protein